MIAKQLFFRTKPNGLALLGGLAACALMLPPLQAQEGDNETDSSVQMRDPEPMSLNPQPTGDVPSTPDEAPEGVAANLTDDEPSFPDYDDAIVTVQREDWDGDGQNDGVAVYPLLMDRGDIVRWEGAVLTVDVGLYESRIGDDYEPVKESTVYEGVGTLENWKDGNPYFDEADGIRVPWSDMDTEDVDDLEGLAEVTINGPDGPVTTTSRLAPIQPEKDG
ncbi:MAG: hypothetical protein ACFE0O_05665 [Opitutales bacterium]